MLRYKVWRWHTAMRGWTEEDTRVLLILQQDIWYWAFLDWLSWDVGTNGCEWLHKVPIPKFICNIKHQWDEDGDFDPCTFGEYYGDDIGCMWHLFVCSPFLNWVWKHRKEHIEIEFEMTLAEARVKFADFPEKYQWVEKNLEEHKAYDAEKAAEQKDDPVEK
jgi:hypothetical protein